MRVHRFRRLTPGLAAGCALLLLAACSKDTPVSPGVSPEIINQGNGNFQFQVTAMKNYSGTLQYNWSNTGTMADVNQSCAITGGTVSLRILDAGGNEVYLRDLNQNGSFVSTAGTPGTWKIIVACVGGSGDLNFRVDTRP